MSKRVVYKPQGAALEYSDLALNLYKGCSHACTYCYAPIATCVKRENFTNAVEPKGAIIERLRRDLRLIEKNNEFTKSPVLMSFTCDPYQPLEEDLQLTRTAIQLLNLYEYPVKILTKGGDLAQRDFDLLSQFQGNEFGVTLTLLDPKIQQVWEPNAASPKQRIENLKEAKKRNIKTWLSLEPIIDLEQALDVIDETYEFTDFYGVGKLNYNKHQKTIDWKDVNEKVTNKLTQLKKDFKNHKSLDAAAK